MIQGRKLLEQGLIQLNIQFTDKQIEQFMKYYDLLIEKNKVMNLTAITDLNEVMTKHFLDSVLISNVLDMSDFYTLVDVGTGAGFPGIPIKILFPHLKVTLIDSLNKRLKFLDDVISELELDGIETVHGRAEDLGNNDLYREKYRFGQGSSISLPKVMALHRRGSISHTGWSFDWNNPSMNYLYHRTFLCPVPYVHKVGIKGKNQKFPRLRKV